MAARFIAIVANDAGTRQGLKQIVAEHSPLPLVFEGGPLLVFAEPAEQVVKGDGRGCVIGHLFARQPITTSVTRIAKADTALILSSQGAHLRDQYWGGYAAFFVGDYNTLVIRDPSGALPVYEFRYGGARVFTSDMETVIAAGLLRPHIDWAFLSQHLYNAGLRSARTALTGVTELLPGFKLSLYRTGERCLSPFWSPWDYIQPAPSADDSEQEQRLGQIVRACISAWASRYRQIVTGVSGGLDSSVIAATLANGSANSACLTLATDEPEGDERPYARLLTKALNLPLYEHLHDPAKVDLRRSVSSYLPRPMGNFISQSTEAARTEVANALPFDAYFSGRGGDNVFCYMQSATPLLDRIKAEGLSAGAWRTLYDLCRLTDCSVWDVAKLGIVRAMPGGNAYHWQGQPGFLHPDVIPESVSYHPWLDAPKEAPIGKAVHVVMLMRIQGTLEGFSRYAPAELVTPLLSQPIMELCLSIPSWVWCTGGVNRAPVRRAFSKDLPPTILQRRTKGGPDSFCIEVIERNRDQLRKILLDGQLAAHGLLDTAAVERCLPSNAPIIPPSHLHLAILAEAEAWAQCQHQALTRPQSFEQRRM